MSLTLKQLDAFVRVVDLASFRRAAERLATTQPNISARIAALEAALGAPLLLREGGSVRPTVRGERLLVHARRVLNERDALIEAAQRSQLADGVLKLGVTELIANTWLSAFLSAFAERYPNVIVELTVELSRSLDAELAERVLDLTFQNAPFQRATSGEVSLGEYPLTWVAAPTLSLGEPARLDDATLARVPVLTHARDSALYRELAEHPTRMRLVPSSHLTACLQMAIGGMGVTALPRALLHEALASGRLREVQHDWTPAPLTFYARFDAERAPALVRDAAELAASIAHDHDR